MGWMLLLPTWDLQPQGGRKLHERQGHLSGVPRCRTCLRFEQVSRGMSFTVAYSQCPICLCLGHRATMRQSISVVAALTTFRPVRCTVTLPVTLSVACWVLRLSSPESFLAGVYSWGHGSYRNTKTPFFPSHQCVSTDGGSSYV